MSTKPVTLLVAVGVVPLLLTGCLGSVLMLGGSLAVATSACSAPGPAVTVDLAGVGSDVAGYDGEQLRNAAAIINAGEVLGLDVKGQTLGVMAAMGESSLRVIDRGDAVGPDSRGLFQQRANGAWGSYTDRMDPTISATNFFRALTRVPGWETLPPTIAVHRTQRNADPYHYSRYWDGAVAIVQALSGAPTPGLAQGTGALVCVGATPGAVTADGWTRPVVGGITSRYGMRKHPITGVTKLHSGTDFGAACETSIYAAAAGTVVKAGAASGYGTLITLDHGGGVTSRYAHMWPNGVLVGVGDTVTAGQQIGRVGSSGYSTGCHLHFEVLVGGDFTDPEPYMSARGARLA